MWLSLTSGVYNLGRGVLSYKSDGGVVVPFGGLKWLLAEDLWQYFQQVLKKKVFESYLYYY